MEFAVTMVIDVLFSRLIRHAPHFGDILCLLEDLEQTL